MDSVEGKTTIIRKSHVFTKYSSTHKNGREYSLMKDATNSSYRFDANESEAEIENKILESRGISIVDSKPPNYNRISPKEVSDYYKSLGEWQNVLPKTDYTYSPASRYYGKKINGLIPLIPNMSRRNIWINRETVDNDINLCRAKNNLFEQSYSERSSIMRTRAASWVYKIMFSAAKTTSTFIRNACLRTFKRITWTHNEEKSSSSSFSTSLWSLFANANIWKKFVLVAFIGFLLYFLTSNSDFFRIFVPSYQFFCYEDIVKPFVKLFSWLIYLVVNIYELTCSSVIFALSMISSSCKHALDIASAITFTPIYNFVCQFWFSLSTSAYSENVREKGESSRVDIDMKYIEHLFRRLLDENEAKFVKNVLSSEEFVNFLNEKFKKLEEKENERFDQFSQLFDSKTMIFQRKLSDLEEKVGQIRLDETSVLKDQVRGLRDEIRIKEAQIENEFIILLISILDLKEGSNFEDLKNKFASIFQSIESVHLKIDKLNREFVKYAENTSNTFDTTFERSKNELKHDLRFSLDEMITKKLQEWKDSVAASNLVKGQRIEHLEEYVKNIIKKALEIYDADKTGQADYALESSGGIILSTRCTETKTANAQFSIFGIPLWHTSRSPRTVIQPGVHPGECWAFPGSTGYLVIQLSERIIVTGFTLEHIPKSLASNGTIDSAPKDFSVWALRWESDPESKLLGNFRFEEDGPSLQYFDSIRLRDPYQIVELKILSNHGKVDYTCLYRFRVHGIPA